MKIFTFRTQLYSPWDYFKNLGCISGKLSKHKAWELEHSYYSGALIDIDISIGCNEDHAGLDMGLGLLGYGIHFKIYDTRHWNCETDSWEIYNDNAP